MSPMTRARLLPRVSPISGIPASKTTKITEMRSRCPAVTGPAAPIAAVTAKESSPSGSTKASSFNTPPEWHPQRAGRPAGPALADSGHGDGGRHGAGGSAAPGFRPVICDAGLERRRDHRLGHRGGFGPVGGAGRVRPGFAD